MNTAKSKKIEIILATLLTVLFLALAAGFWGYSYFKFKTPIKKVEFVPQGTTSMTINITSSQPLKTKVEYGTSDYYLNSSTETDTFQTSQSHTIWGLLPEKPHFFRIVAQDESGKEYKTKFYQY